MSCTTTYQFHARTALQKSKDFSGEQWGTQHFFRTNDCFHIFGPFIFRRVRNQVFCGTLMWNMEQGGTTGTKNPLSLSIFPLGNPTRIWRSTPREDIEMARPSSFPIWKERGKGREKKERKERCFKNDPPRITGGERNKRWLITLRSISLSVDCHLG